MTGTGTAEAGQNERPAHLARALNLPLAVLFGLGVTIGAGIYVLVGATAGRAGLHAPLAFVLAAIVMAPSAASFAELASRMPVSAGEAAYVRAGFRSEALAVAVGFMVIAIGIISAAAISRGSAGYVHDLVGLPLAVIVPLVVLAMGAIATWGILESVAFASLMTVIEIGGLVAIIAVGFTNSPDIVVRVPEIWTGAGSPTALAGILSAALLSFFAFIGFESLSNIAEEVKEPRRTLPRAIFITLLLATVLYILVAWVALAYVAQGELAASHAPLSLVFGRVTGASPKLISVIAVIATLNGIIAQMVMSSRVIYGMADRKLLPKALARVSPLTRTPLIATLLVIALVLALSMAAPLEHLADLTSRLTLVVFAAVNAALALLKLRGEPPPEGAFVVPTAVPVLGTLFCLALLAAGLVY